MCIHIIQTPLHLALKRENLFPRIFVFLKEKLLYYENNITKLRGKTANFFDILGASAIGSNMTTAGMGSTALSPHVTGPYTFRLNGPAP